MMTHVVDRKNFQAVEAEFGFCIGFGGVDALGSNKFLKVVFLELVDYVLRAFSFWQDRALISSAPKSRITRLVTSSPNPSTQHRANRSKIAASRLRATNPPRDSSQKVLLHSEPVMAV